MTTKRENSCISYEGFVESKESDFAWFVEEIGETDECVDRVHVQEQHGSKERHSLNLFVPYTTNHTRQTRSIKTYSRPSVLPFNSDDSVSNWQLKVTPSPAIGAYVSQPDRWERCNSLLSACTTYVVFVLGRLIQWSNS